jgi:hypothetical protein
MHACVIEAVPALALGILAVAREIALQLSASERLCAPGRKNTCLLADLMI